MIVKSYPSYADNKKGYLPVEPGMIEPTQSNSGQSVKMGTREIPSRRVDVNDGLGRVDKGVADSGTLTSRFTGWWSIAAAASLVLLASIVNPFTLVWLKGGPIESTVKWAATLGVAFTLVVLASLLVWRRNRAGGIHRAFSRLVAISIPLGILGVLGFMAWKAYTIQRVDINLVATGTSSGSLSSAVSAWRANADAVSGDRLLVAVARLEDRFLEPDELWDTQWNDETRRRVEQLMSGDFVGLLDPRGRGNPPSLMMPQVDWRRDSKGTLGYSLHRQRYLFDLIRAERESGDTRYLDRAKTLALSWIRGNPLWLHSLRKNQVFEVRNHLVPYYAWNDDTTSGRVTEHLALMFALLERRMLSPVEAEEILSSLVRHARLLVRDDFYSAPTNHGVMQVRALLLASVVLSDLPESKEWQRVAIERLERQMRENVSAAGVHRELSVAYHYYVLRAFVYCHILAERAGIELSAEYENRLRAMLRFATEIVYPDGTAPRLGDSLPTELAKDFGLARWPDGEYAKWEETRLLKRIQTGESLDPQTVRPFLLGSDLLHTRHRVGEAGELFDVVMIAPRWRPAHAHRDALSVYLYWMRPLLVGPGYPSGPSELVEWATGTTAHNTLTVDGVSHGIGDASLDPMSAYEGVAALGCPKVTVARGAHELYPGVRVERDIAILVPGVVVVADHILADKPRTFRQHYNFPSTISMTAAGNEIRLSDPLRGPVLRVKGWVKSGDGHWGPARAESARGIELTPNGFIDAPSLAFVAEGKDAMMVSVIEALGPETTELANSGPDAVRAFGVKAGLEVLWGDRRLDVKTPSRTCTPHLQ